MEKKQKLILIFCALTVLISGWSYTYDTATPTGSDDPAEADDRMREIKAAVQEREDVDHYWPKTGTEVSEADVGEHRKITLRTISAAVVTALTATKAYLYRLVTDGELYFKDASDNTIQLTSGGKILSASLDMKDEDDMSSDSATHAITQQSAKAFAESAAAAAAAAVDSADDFTPTSYAGEESVTLPNGLIIKMGIAGTSGGWGNHTVTFETPFPNGIITAVCNNSISGAQDRNNFSSTFNKTANSFRTYGNGGSNIQWIAIGY